MIRQVWPLPHGHSVLSPFEASEDFTQACWQADEVIATSPSDLFYSFTRDGEEVVRLIVVDHPELDPGYGVPEAGDGLEIDFMEVAQGHRRQGFGTQAIELLRRQHPGPTMFARPPESEDAFWRSLGWERGLSPTVPEALTGTLSSALARCFGHADLSVDGSASGHQVTFSVARSPPLIAANLRFVACSERGARSTQHCAS
jgi:GNAT superfamily N-acetyltransferase